MFVDDFRLTVNISAEGNLLPGTVLQQRSERAGLLERLQSRTLADPRYWDFSQLGKRQGTHSLFQYPAMMVPELQGALLDDVLALRAGRSLIYDPFAGSGTVLVEAMNRRADFVGSDINPMAILLMTVKADPPSASDAGAAAADVLKIVEAPRGSDLPRIPNLDKWFEARIQTQLLALQHGIRHVEPLNLRRFLWVCLAETVRLTSNSRISTFKLHAYSEAQRAVRTVDASKTFASVSRRNARALEVEAARSRPDDGFRSRPHEDHSRVTLLPGAALDCWPENLRPDILMTSPPYGDNKTTVPYGQHSYLPLAWIDGPDVPGGVNDALLASTSHIDSRSLGGSIIGAQQSLEALQLQAPSAAAFAVSLSKASLVKKVLAFSRDYAATLSAAAQRLEPDAFCFLTLGERQVGGRSFPLVDVTMEILRASGQEKVTVIERSLPVRKRIGPRNSEGGTMATEYVLVTRGIGS